MDRIFRHKDGSFFLKTKDPHLIGVFRLQLVSPLDVTIDERWFEQELDNGKIVEYEPSSEV